MVDDTLIDGNSLSFIQKGYNTNFTNTSNHSPFSFIQIDQNQLNKGQSW
jgi:hypothetical protein